MKALCYALFHRTPFAEPPFALELGFGDDRPFHNVKGKPRRLPSYIGGVGRYRQECNEVAAKGARSRA